ncbi:MAG: hypothetical protein M0Q46_06540 [Endomicrobiales bacterium]|nr:hypothetical protein [Endomicrobiales bacterium]
MGTGGFLKQSAALCVALFVCQHFMWQALKSKQIEVAIVDTAEREEWIYKPFVDSLKNTGCHVTYKSLDDIIDQTSAHLSLAKYNAVFFVLSLGFLNSINQSHLCSKVLSLMHNYAMLAGKVVGIVLPPIFTQARDQLLLQCAPLLNALGIEKNLVYGDFAWQQLGLTFETEREKAQKNFLWLLKFFMTHPLETRPIGYHTTLSAPHRGVDFLSSMASKSELCASDGLFLLPLACNDVDGIVQQTLPYGMYWFNEKYKNHVFFTYSSALSFAGIVENFHVCPIDIALRDQMLELVQRMTGQVMQFAQLKSKKDVCDFGRKIVNYPAEPKRFPGIVFEEAFYPTAKARKIAWMDMDVFYSDDVKGPWKGQDREKARQDLIDYVYEAKLDALWLTINPQMYYSFRARLPGAEKLKQFWDALECCAQQIKQGANRHNGKIPSILIGYEIANNIYAPHLPKRCAVDMFEQVYQDLPSPIDQTFWETEVAKPLHVFVKEWNSRPILKQVTLGGVVIDLEMYCRKKSGMFLTSMSYDAATFNKFMSLRDGKKSNKVPRRDRILRLMQVKGGNLYYRYLEQEAEKIGKYLQKSFVQVLGNPLIMCYLPQISVSWFYKGLYKGLAAGYKDPLYLLTFNSAFAEHAPWFVKNKIPVNHASVMMLSKFEKHADFDIAKRLGRRHPTLWFNKFSRFVDLKGVAGWTNIEQPAIGEDAYHELAEYIGTL